MIDSPIVAHLVRTGRVPAAALAPEAFPDLLAAHQAAYPGADAVEALGHVLTDRRIDGRLLDAFLWAVCGWGRRPQIAANVMEQNARRTRRAWAALARGDAADALAALTELKGLGGVSFASKHLRMLKPTRCVVYDRILDTALGKRYRFAGTRVSRNPAVREDYARLCRDFRKLARALNVRGIPRPSGGCWRAADTEAAVFMAVRA